MEVAVAVYYSYYYASQALVAVVVYQDPPFFQGIWNSVSLEQAPRGLMYLARILAFRSSS